MPVGFGDIDLNSDVVPDERNGGVHEVFISESTVGSDEVLGCGDGGSNKGGGMGHAEREKDGKLDDVAVGGEIVVNNGEGNVLINDRYRGDSMCFEKSNGGREENFGTFLEETVVDRSGESRCVGDEVGGEVAAVPVTCCGEEGEGRSAGLQTVEVDMGGEIVVNKRDGNVPINDTNRGDSMCFEKNNGCREENFSTFPEETVVDRSGESRPVGDEVEGEVATVLVMRCGEEGEDRSAGLQTVEVDMGAGDSVNLQPVYGDTIPIPTDVASGSLNGGVKPDECSSLVTADGGWHLGSRMGNERTEVKCDPGIVAHLVDHTASIINGFDSNGNRGVVIKEQRKDPQQLEHNEKESVKQAALKPESKPEEYWTEKGQFHMSDLVWGKVRSHPWWPGLIFDPSEASEKASRYRKKDGFLIAYFGDKTFAWNEASRIKPFKMHFSQMEKQSNTEAFCHAVDCALEEVSRRVEFGLACSCLSEEMYDQIKTFVVINAGIREESSRRDGGDGCSTAESFMPVNLVRYMKAVAQSPYDGTDKLEFVIARAQLLAFNRWKGFYQLPEFNMLGGWLEDGVDIRLTGERTYSEVVTEDAVCFPSADEQFPLRKGKLAIQDTSSRKRKEISGDGVSPSKKERCLSDLMSGGHSKLSNGEGDPEGKAGRHLTSSSSAKKRKALDSVPDDSRVKNKKVSLSPVTKKQFSRVGESIRRVANQLAMSSPILKDDSEKTIGENGSSTRPSKSEKSKRRKISTPEYPPLDEMLSQLYMASKDRMKWHKFMTSSVSFFSNFRNSFCLEKSTSQEHKYSTGKVSGKRIAKKLSNTEFTETSGLEGMEDSYWTDRIVQNITEEQVLFEPETPNEKGSPTVEPEAALESGHKLDPTQESAVVKCETDIKPVVHMEEPTVEPEAALELGHELDSKQASAVAECETDIKPVVHTEEKNREEEYTPTALILNFADLASIPSESNLNNIFSRYGPLNESGTEVLKNSKRAKVVFRRRRDAETAFSSSGKFSTFGPSLVSYRLSHLPSTTLKTSTSAKKRSKKGVASIEGNGA